MAKPFDHRDRSNESDFEKEEERTTSTGSPFALYRLHIIVSHLYKSERDTKHTNFPNNLNIGACNGEKKRGDNAKKDNRRKERKKRGIVKVVDKMNDDDESGARATTDDKDDDIIERTTRGEEEVSSSSSSSCFVSFSLLRVVR